MLRSTTRLITAAFAGQELTSTEVQQIAEHVAASGFDPERLIQVGDRLIGVVWRGERLSRLILIPTAEAHYLRHVIAREEWPKGTTLEQYQESAADIARNPGSGVFVSRYRGIRAIGIVGPTGNWRGKEGSDETLVEYSVSIEHWTTAFQLREGLSYLTHQQAREGFQWLRHPK